MSIVTLDMRDGMTPELHKLSKRARNLSPAMKKIQFRVMGPLKRRAWRKSGLRSESGELQDAVTTWHGKKSAGVSIRTSKGKDLVLPKATLHTHGAKKGQYRRKDRYKVRAHSRGGRSVTQHYRRNIGSPRGDIKARPFIPKELSAADNKKAIAILEDYLDV